MRRMIVAVVAMGLSGAAGLAQPVKVAAPAGSYTLDPSHADLSFRLSHLGFSMYTARFATFDAKLGFNPANLAKNSVTATIDARSLTLPTPPAGFKDTLLGPQWLDAAKYPTIRFRSTKVEPTGPASARITGELTLHGVTKPVTLDAKYNGGWAGIDMDPHARIGFSATGSFRRSAFGVSFGVPAPGTNMGVGDEVQIAIEAEFSGPPKK
ncbi:MAG: polyisoprenoid-binding protein [Sphingomonas bacterium]|nr:polyisoprenoid-binding protein [Sphingomonas bacterium]